MTPESAPRTGHDDIHGLKYFPRMLDKIRKYQAGTLHEDFHPNLGISMDGQLCDILNVDYAKLRAFVEAGATDQEAYEWCEKEGRPITENFKIVWNGFANKLGWDDHITDKLALRKEQSGLGDRDDIVYMIDYFDFDEGRRS
ncbi:MAG: DUF5069 domain-containing protein [Opitutales bacterium]